MFYQCPKCKKIWQYPIEKCPDCFSVLEKMEGGKIKVVGVSKVNIPTLLHPRVPYFVLLLEDERGNKWVQKSVKEYNIGDEFKFKSGENQNGVAIWRLKYDILEGIEKVVEFLGGLNISSKTKILILPTLISPTHPHFRENTSPEFLENLIKFLLQKGGKAENFKVAGQSFTDIPIEASAQKSQLLDVCNRHQITPLDLAKTNFRKKGDFEVTQELFSANLVLNLPILKVGKASATENLLKFIKKENYFGLKYLSSEENIIKNLIPLLPKILTIGEAQAVQKPDGYTIFLGLILASFNFLNLDRVFGQICNIKDLPGCLKSVNIENIPIWGREIEELQYEVEKF